MERGTGRHRSPDRELEAKLFAGVPRLLSGGLSGRMSVVWTAGGSDCPEKIAGFSPANVVPPQKRSLARRPASQRAPFGTDHASTQTASLAARTGVFPV